MHLLARYSPPLPRQVYDMAYGDDWNPILLLATNSKDPGIRALLATLLIDHGHHDGLKHLLDHGLDPNATVPRSCLRSLGFKSDKVSLVELAMASSHQGIRGGDSAAPFFLHLLSAGAVAPLLVLSELIEHDDARALDAVLLQRPGIFKDALEKGVLSSRTRIYSPETMSVLLDHGLPIQGRIGMAQWLWSVEPETCHQSPQVVQLLASRGLDLDIPNPNHTNPEALDMTLLEHDLRRPDLVEEDSIPFLEALIRCGARIDRLDGPAIIASVPRLEAALESRWSELRAGILEQATPLAPSPPRPARI